MSDRLVQSRRSRQTGTTVEVWEGLDGQPGWQTVCVEHGGICEHDTRRVGAAAQREEDRMSDRSAIPLSDVEPGSTIGRHGKRWYKVPANSPSARFPGDRLLHVEFSDGGDGFREVPEQDVEVFEGVTF